MAEKKKNSRREFLALGLIAGAGALTGAGIKAAVSDTQTETRKMMTASGEVVEVEIRHLPKKKNKDEKKPISNAELKQWMENDKN